MPPDAVVPDEDLEDILRERNLDDHKQKLKLLEREAASVQAEVFRKTKLKLAKVVDDSDSNGDGNSNVSQDVWDTGSSDESFELKPGLLKKVSAPRLRKPKCALSTLKPVTPGVLGDKGEGKADAAKMDYEKNGYKYLWFRNGWIVYNSTNINAHCETTDHDCCGKFCHMNRSRASNARRPGQGRPLGLLGLWLARGHDCARDKHNSVGYKSELGQKKHCEDRKAIRRAMVDDPRFAEVLRMEADLGGPPNAEPEVVPRCE